MGMSSSPIAHGSGGLASLIVVERFEHGAADVLVDDGGVDVGDLGALGETIDDERVQRVGVFDADVQQEVLLYDALDRLASDGTLGSGGTIDIAVVVSLIVFALVLGAATLRRQTT
jgi:hypothetical protein